MKRLLSLAPFMLGVILPFLSVQACGPDFSPDVFVHRLHPDHPADYAAGKLGVLVPTYPRGDLTVAFRYLNGGSLTPEEQRAYHPMFSVAEEIRESDAADADQAKPSANGTQYAEPPGPADLWLKVRARYASPQPDLHSVREFDMIYSEGYFLAASYEKCQADAFRTSSVTLENRVRIWGAHSSQLADWLKGQDAVFSNCGTGAPAVPYPVNRPVIHPTFPVAAPSDAPTLLRQDRAYQIAAAQFYASQFALARASFQAIARDTASPWCGIARYLVARALVRQAFLTTPNGLGDGNASFDADLMKQAQRELESMVGGHLPGISPRAVQSLLNLVRIRTDPQARLREMSAALAGPKSDPYYENNLGDFTWYLNERLDSLPVRENASDFAFHIEHDRNDYRPFRFEQKLPGFDKAFQDLADLRKVSSLIDWLITFQSPSDLAKKHAVVEWKRTGGTPWLVAAIMKAPSSDAAASDLIDAASRIPSTSPAWLTVTFHRERLLIETGKIEQARLELDGIMPAVKQSRSESAVNLFAGLRMRAAAKLEDALGNAPRKILERTSEEQSSIDECLGVMKNPKRKYDCKKDNSLMEFSEDAAAVFNTETPLVTLAQAAQSSALSLQLRQSVVMMAWVRSVLLKNEAVEAQMRSLLPAKLREQAGSGVGLHPLMTLLRNPGLRPYLDGGVQRSASYDFVESFSNNWWCSDWTTTFSDVGAPARARSVAFLSPQALEAGEKEAAAILAMGSADNYLGSQVVDYASAHPSEPDVPEALFLTLRMIRYGCKHGRGTAADKENSDRITSIAQEVGAMMRQRYAGNPWTKKAAPYVWLGNKDD